MAAWANHLLLITFGIEADIVCTAKAIANGVIPMGAVFAHDHVYDAFMQGPEELIELFHGYTYSGNPMACAAALATLDTYEEENLFNKGTLLWEYWEDAVHSLRGLPHVKDIRNMGLIGAVELESIPGKVTKRATEAFLKAYDKGLLIRTTGGYYCVFSAAHYRKTPYRFHVWDYA